MASGRTHETVNLVALGGLAAGYAWARSHGWGPAMDGVLPAQARLALLVAYLIGTFLVTPDLDLAENRVRAKTNWGLLGLLWVPYGLMFRHRGLSHSWIVGPATRLAYMALLAVAAGWLASALGPAFGYEFRFEARLERYGREIAIGALAGYYLSQWLHLLADGLGGGKGRRKRGR